jgi:hypothetical protein
LGCAGEYLVLTECCFGAFLSKLRFWLKRRVGGLSAFFVPLAIRSIPEILAWPYPIGFDTLAYIHIISSNQVFLSGPFGFVKFQLFYSLATLLNWLIANPVVVADVLGPLLMGLVAFMMYAYAHHALKWSGFKSFIVAIFVGTYFVSLRNSWDLYVQSLALVFLLAALLVIKTSISNKRYVYAFVFVILTVLSHDLVAVILFFVLGLEAVRFLLKKQRSDFAFLSIMFCFAAVLVLFTHYSSQEGVVFPLVSNATAPSADLAFYIGGFLVYCYIFVLPLVILGFASLKDLVLRCWTFLCIGVTFVIIVFPSLPLYVFDRWGLLLVYPLMFFAVNGLYKLWTLFSRHRNKIVRLVPKIFAIVYLVFLLYLSGFYLVATPENQISYFSKDNNYLAFIPSGMNQNVLPISDNPSLVECFEWINDRGDSLVLMHRQLYNYALICLDSSTVTLREFYVGWNSVNETIISQQMVEDAKSALAEGYNVVYTVWWIEDEGWYASFALPHEFTEVYRSGEIAVYLFNQAT